MTTETTERPAAAPAAPAPAAVAPAAAPAAAAPAEPSAAPPAAPAAQGSEEVSPPAGAAPDDWRATAISQVFGEPKDDDSPEVKTEREKVAKLAAKYNTVGEALKALRAAQVKLSDGTLKAAKPPKNATPEQVAEWRQLHGIPESPDKYDIKLPSGVVLGDTDKPVVDRILQSMHSIDATPEVANQAVKAYLDVKEAEVQALAERDVNDALAVEAELQPLWGSDYRKNLQAVSSMLKQGGSEIANAIANARGPDRKGLMNNPAVVQWLASHARELGFVGQTIVPAGGDLGEAVDNEIETIKKSMYNEDGTRNPAYWRNEKAQKRFHDLLTAQARHKA